MNGLSTMANKKRTRRTKAEMAFIRRAIYDVAKAMNPITDRSIFYQLVNRPVPVLEKLESQYKGTVIRLVGEMRERGELPWGWITDNTRLQRKPRTHFSLEDALIDTAERYRRQIWADQDVYVEVWCEKVGMSGVLYPITAKWDVPLMLAGGSSSKTFLYEAAKSIEQENKPAFIYYLGDFDPSGVAFGHRIERDLKRYAPTADITFTRLAVTEDQIAQYNLPTRPTKKDDPNAKKFGDRQSVDVDAMAPTVLREMIERVIESHIDPWALRQLRLAEKAERESLLSIVNNMDKVLAAVGGAR